MTTILYLLTLMLPLATILIVFGMRYYASVRQASARLANDDAYRQLAEIASAAQSQIATAWPPWRPTCRTCAPALPPSRPF